jgi:hypothetical protein
MEGSEEGEGESRLAGGQAADCKRGWGEGARGRMGKGLSRGMAVPAFVVWDVCPPRRSQWPVVKLCLLALITPPPAPPLMTPQPCCLTCWPTHARLQLLLAVPITPHTMTPHDSSPRCAPLPYPTPHHAPHTENDVCAPAGDV